MTASDAAHARPRCLDCLRPIAMCRCAELPRVPTRTRIVVLQHPHERVHPFGTARLVRLCMPNASVHVPCPGFRGTLAEPVDVPPDAAVLYPHPDAADLASLPAAEHPSTLIALDGTWAHAKRLYRDNTWLHARRHVRLTPSAPSRYRIRREPRPDYVSTLEAIVAALRIVEPDCRGLDDLLAAFDRMIDQQLAHVAATPRVVRRKLPRARASRTLPPELFDPRLCVVYAEIARPADRPSDDCELVHFVAARIDGEDTFDALIRPSGALPSAARLAHQRVTAAELLAGEPLAAAAARFARFAGPGAPVAAWTDANLAHGAPLFGPDRPRAVLKAAYCNVVHRRAGRLDAVLACEGLQPIARVCRGRAGERLANALALARWLRDGAAAAVAAEHRRRGSFSR